MTSESSYPEKFENLPAQILLMEKEISMKGWMLKKSGREKFALTQLGQYDRRFFIVFNGWVYYYKEKTADKPQGSFSLEGYSNHVTPAEEEQSPSLRYVFKVYPRNKNGRTYYFATENQELMNHWRESFRCEIEKYNAKHQGSKLTGSFSMPEKTNHRRLAVVNELEQGRSMSVSSSPKHRNVSKNSMSSSQSSESRESLSSFPTDDRLFPYNSDQLYEPIESDDIQEVEDQWIPHDTIPSPSYKKPLPAFPLPNISTSQLPENSYPNYQSDDLYDTIDDKDVTPMQFHHGIPAFTSPPQPPPLHNKPQNRGLATPEKQPLFRVSSIPSKAPPEPPTKPNPSYPDEEYEEPEFYRVRLPTVQEKITPPLPSRGDPPDTDQPMYTDTITENEELAYEVTLDHRSRFRTFANHKKAVSLDNQGTYDDTISMNANHPRHHSIATISDQLILSKGLPPALPTKPVLTNAPPKPPSTDSKPMLTKPNNLPLKPSMLKNTEKHITSPPTVTSSTKPHMVGSPPPVASSTKPHMVGSPPPAASSTKPHMFGSPSPAASSTKPHMFGSPPPVASSTKPHMFGSPSPVASSTKPHMVGSPPAVTDNTKPNMVGSPPAVGGSTKPQTPLKPKFNGNPNPAPKPGFLIDKTESKKPYTPPVAPKSKLNPSPNKIPLNFANSELFSKAKKPQHQPNVTSPTRNINAKPVPAVGPKPVSTAASYGKVNTFKSEKNVSDKATSTSSNPEPELASVLARVKMFGANPPGSAASPTKPLVSKKPQNR